jgi:hypothetical protein
MLMHQSALETEAARTNPLGSDPAEVAAGSDTVGHYSNECLPFQKSPANFFTECGHLEMMMNYFIPYYVNERQSDVRGIKCGWYTMDERGNLGDGPFLSPGECLGTDSQARETPKSTRLH